MTEYRRVAALRTAADFLAYLGKLGVELPFDAELDAGAQASLAQPLDTGIKRVGNRFTVLPMEGWDGTTGGHPTELTQRRWERFGRSGAKLIWGGEAVAVRPDGRANPNQLMILNSTVEDLARLRTRLVQTHERHFGASDDLLVGLQLTHSGRFARPYDKQRLEPRTLYAHPLLDAKFHVDAERAILADDEIERLIDDFVAAAVLAQEAGFAFVDIKHCHGYLGHEFLSAVDRQGKYGGTFLNRTRFLREIVAGIRRRAPGLGIGVRLSAFDFVPFQEDTESGRGIPVQVGETYRYAFGADPSGLTVDLQEPLAFLDLLQELEIRLVCVTAGSPYYNPHIQRPAFFPPSDGYLPPEDPLVGVARQIGVVAALKRQRPELVYVGSGYSYLQDWLPNVAQAAVRSNLVDTVGLGRMVLAYPELPADVLAGRPLQRKRICRTFSDCTTAPRNGMVSGCYPLDEFYKARPEHAQLLNVKQAGQKA
ncbi:MAG: NADH:flavin oxidoreductase [Caldilineaceae bacterium]|nr:NADH:flavin oxidoreductase [Caldilineaceae bacterium]